MPQMRTFPLTEEILQKLRTHVRAHCQEFASTVVFVDSLSALPGSRPSVESLSWPIDGALEYFQAQGVGKRVGNEFHVLNPDYFAVAPPQIAVPVSFSIDARIQSDLLIMIDVYAQIYDVENRLRFFLHRKLTEKYGQDFVPNLPAQVRNNIAAEKSRSNLFVIDPRRGDLEFTHFNDLKRVILSNEEFVTEPATRSVLLEKLDFLHSIRNLVAHNNLVAPAEMARIRDNCEVVRRAIAS